MSVCPFVRLSVAKMRVEKRDFLKKTKKFRTMVSIEDLYELIHGLFKEPIIGPLRFKMTEIRHLENSESPHLNEKFRPAIYMNINYTAPRAAVLVSVCVTHACSL